MKCFRRQFCSGVLQPLAVLLQGPEATFSKAGVWLLFGLLSV